MGRRRRRKCGDLRVLAAGRYVPVVGYRVGRGLVGVAFLDVAALGSGANQARGACFALTGWAGEIMIGISALV